MTTRRLALLFLPVLVLLGSCATQPSAVPYTQPGPYAVGFSAETPLNDTTRERQFGMIAWYPRAPLDKQTLAKPLPLVVLSHGFGGTASELGFIAQHLASHGYLVVAPEFPNTSRNRGVPLDVNDVIRQPGDLSWLIDAALGENDQFPAALRGLADPERIAAVGLSLGGVTTLLVSYDPELRDPRIKVAVPLAAGGGDFFLPTFYDNAEVPLLWIHGSADAYVDYQAVALPAFERANSPTALLTLEQGSHLGFTDFALGLSAANPDAVGCQAFPEIDENDEDNFYQYLAQRQPNGGIGAFTAPLPCTFGAEKLPSMRTARQHELTRAAVLAFLESFLATDAGARESAMHYLREEFGRANQDTRLRFK